MLKSYKTFFLALGCFGLLFFAVPGRSEEVLTWEQCLTEALDQHPDLRAAEEKVKQSQADKSISVSDALPQITSQVSGRKSKTAGSSETDAYTYSVTGQQLVFDAFKTGSEIKAAMKTLNAAEYNYMVTSSNVRLNLRVAFSGLLRAQQLVALTEEIAKRRKENLELVQVRHEAGREHKGAVLTAEADLSQADFEVAQAKRNLSLAKQQLTKALGRDKKEDVVAQGDFNISEAEGLEVDFEVLADMTPLLQELIAKKESARFNLSSAKAEFFPQVYVSGSFSRTRETWPPEDNAWSAGLTVSLPIFEGGSNVAQMQKAKSQWVQAQENERSGRESVLYTLEKTWKEFQDAFDTVSVKKKFLDAAEERAKIANAQYSSGLTTFNDWIIIEGNLVNAQKNYLDAQENLLVAEAYWVQAKGGTLDYVKE